MTKIYRIYAQQTLNKNSMARVRFYIPNNLYKTRHVFGLDYELRHKFDGGFSSRKEAEDFCEKYFTNMELVILEVLSV